MFQAMGATLDAAAIVDEIARLKDRPEFRRFITFPSQAMPGQLGGDENTIRQSPVTSRTNVRKSVSTGGSPESRSNAMIRDLINGTPSTNGQQSEMLDKAPA